MREALGASPARAAEARARAARDSAALAGVLPNPSVDVRAENWQPGGRAPTDPLNDTFVVLTQPIELNGKAGARRRVAEADATSRTLDVKLAERQLATEVAQHFVAAARARGRRRLLDAQRDSTREVVTILGKRVAEGVTPEGDLRKVEADLGRLDIEATRAQIDLRPASRGSACSSAASTHSANTRSSIPSPRRTTQPPPATATAIPEVASAHQRAAIAAASADLARRERWPDLPVSGGYKRTAGVNTAVAGVSVSLPLFNRGARAIALGQAEQVAAEQEALEAVRRARAEALARVAEARLLAERAVRVEQDVLVPAEVAWRAALTSFREGAGDVLRLLDAERVYGEARRDAQDLKLGAALAQVRARLALGEELP